MDTYNKMGSLRKGLWIFISCLCCPLYALDADHSDTVLSATFVEMIVTTSWATYADSGDNIEATFHGDLSTSGPHIIGPYLNRGVTLKQNLTLDRFIGPLTHIVVQNRGFDGWLPSRVSCIYNRYMYTFDFPKTWLNSFDYDSYLDEGNGYEPRVQQLQSEINSAEHIRLDIQSSIKLNSVTGTRPKDYSLSVDGI